MPPVKNVTVVKSRMTGYPLTLSEIVSWCRSKQRSLADSPVSVIGIRERTEHLPAVAADFNGPDTMGRINGWESGEFDFEVVRVLDGASMFWRHVNVSAVDALEAPYDDFLQQMLSAGASNERA